MNYLHYCVITAIYKGNDNENIDADKLDDEQFRLIENSIYPSNNQACHNSDYASEKCRPDFQDRVSKSNLYSKSMKYATFLDQNIMQLTFHVGRRKAR